MSLRIIITDDHKLFREGIMAIVKKNDPSIIVREASDGNELFEMIPEFKPHVVLLDISMPGMNGLDILEKSRKEHPEIRFIVLTMHAEGQYVVKAVKNGAFGFLLKNTDEEELLAAINQVASGKKFFNPEISNLMIGNMAVEGTTVKDLSPREMEVLELVSEGKPTREIAELLIVSTRTVETHRVNMMKKLKVQNTAELIKKAAQMKLI